MVLLPSALGALLYVALCPGYAPTSADDRTHGAAGIELPRTPWVAGDVIHSTATSHSTLHTIIVSNGQLIQEFDQVEDKSSEKSIFVLACDERGPTRLRVEYGALRFLRNGGGADSGDGRSPGEVEAKNPLEHRTFVLVRRGESFLVLDAHEKRIDEGLGQLVLEEEGLHGLLIQRAGDLVARELAGRALVFGSEITCSHEAARAFVDGHEHFDSARLILVPRSTRDEAGVEVVVCSARLEIADTGRGEQPTTTIDLRGDMQFDLATGRFLAVELKGTLSLAQAIADQTHGVEVTGQGPWTISERVRYDRAP